MKYGYRMKNCFVDWNNLLFLVVPFLVIVQPQEALGDCKSIIFLLAEEEHYLRHHSMENLTHSTQDICQIRCYMHKSCMSYNYFTSSTRCEINDADKYSHPEDLVWKAGLVYVGVDNACRSSPCPGNATCQPNFYTQGYSCLCHPGFSGSSCTDIDECETEAHNCSADHTCVNTEGSFECRCKDGYKMFDNNCTKIFADYVITVYTGNVYGAGTDANVFIKLHGSQFKKEISSSKVKLSGKPNPFERGSVDATTINGELPNMELLSKITMSLDNTGSQPGWKLNKVIVDNKTRRMKYTFQCRCKLGKSFFWGDHPLMVDIGPTTVTKY